MKIQCPCCNGTGTVELNAPVSLSPMEKQIYLIVRRCTEQGISSDAIRTLLYADREDGGPNGFKTLHVQVMKINRKLRAGNIGHRVRANRRGTGALYRLETVTNVV